MHQWFYCHLQTQQPWNRISYSERHSGITQLKYCWRWVLSATPLSLNSPIWTIKKPGCCWCMIVDYQLINKAASPLAALVPDVLTLFKCIEREAATWHAVTEMAHTFFSISSTVEPQEQFDFSWEGLQYTFTVLTQGLLHSPTYLPRVSGTASGE